VKRPPTPRPRIYDLYWYYASERQRMFERRTAGEPGPWTSDPILREGLFCETDKYCREAAPELASARKRIKARFTPATKPVGLFFPPKWAVNDKLPAHPGSRATRPDAHE
jgi:hypothetical protein